MYIDLTTEVDVTIDTSVSPPLVGKPISKIYQVAFANDCVSIIGRYEGDASMQFSYNFTKDELPTEDTKALYDAVIKAVDSIHLSLRIQDKNYETNKWIEIIEEEEEEDAI